MGELWMVRWTQWFYRVFWPLHRLLRYHCVFKHLILHFLLASEDRACTCSFLLCTCRFTTGWFHLPFSERRSFFHLSFLSPLPPFFSLTFSVSLICSYVPLFLQQMWMPVSPGSPLCPPAKWQWQTSRQTPLPSLSEKHKWLRASFETGVRSSESLFAVLPRISAFRVGLGKGYVIPWEKKKIQNVSSKMFTETFFFPSFSPFQIRKKGQCRGYVFVIALSSWKTDSPFPGKDSPPWCESSKLNNSPFILLSGGSCICGERACGGGKRAGSLACRLVLQLISLR